MGCDIHFFTEKKNAKTGKWEKQTGFQSDYYEPGDDYFGSEKFKSSDSLLQRRNYNLFAVLANVRNGSNAWVDRGEPITPISMPRGLPVDISDEIKQQSDEWGADGHSHSWFLLSEIFEYLSGDGLTAKKVNRGWVDVPTYKNFLDTGHPYPCSGAVDGQLVVHAPNDCCIEIQEMNPSKSVYTQIQWETSVIDIYPWFFNDGLKQLKDRSEIDDCSDVRIVFWFDN